MKKASAQAGFEPLTFGSAIRYLTTIPSWHIEEAIGYPWTDAKAIVETQ